MTRGISFTFEFLLLQRISSRSFENFPPSATSCSFFGTSLSFSHLFCVLFLLFACVNLIFIRSATIKSINLTHILCFTFFFVNTTWCGMVMVFGWERESWSVEKKKTRRRNWKKQADLNSQWKNEEFMLHCLVSRRDIVRNLQIFIFLRNICYDTFTCPRIASTMFTHLCRPLNLIHLMCESYSPIWVWKVIQWCAVKTWCLTRKIGFTGLINVMIFTLISLSPFFSSPQVSSEKQLILFFFWSGEKTKTMFLMTQIKLFYDSFLFRSRLVRDQKHSKL